MLVPFESLPPTSRIWIYQADRVILPAQEQVILSDAGLFVNTWTAHQAGLKAGVTILHKAFLIFGVDESYNDASGCSIDKKVNFVKAAGGKNNLDFFNRNLVFFEDGRFIELKKVNEALNSGEISLNSCFYNNLIQTKSDMESSWLVAVKNSWLMNFVHALNT